MEKAARNRSAVGDLVTHKNGGEQLFVVEAWLEPVDENVEPLYQCSQASRYDFGCHGYSESLLTKAESVSVDQRPDAIKRAGMILSRLLEAAEEGGMRRKRAQELFEEFRDHWLQNSGEEGLTVVSHTLDHIQELLQSTRYDNDP